MSEPMMDHYYRAQQMITLLDNPHVKLSTAESISVAQLHATMALVDQLRHVANWAVNNG